MYGHTFCSAHLEGPANLSLAILIEQIGWVPVHAEASIVLSLSKVETVCVGVSKCISISVQVVRPRRDRLTTKLSWRVYYRKGINDNTYKHRSSVVD